MNNLVAPTIDTTDLPNQEGYFGEYGGSYVSADLQKLMDELKASYEKISEDPTFVEELADLLVASLELIHQFLEICRYV